ncbi:uncharacterized protein LOC110460893 [Mizuhopecten yessoensis]|uniref:Uncharacterized protein n=1 Tax=Mizuhopecten yessoensis TaxID=6573 RepID=A0A210R2Q4_MIZYE|nr:uncharacterized protein LOC110460893 [Mizuhopecten yessoensis]OWF55380.1 hypothetical protein KP79_PYT21710 [Mizuhopecten yessoensis]
MGCLPSKKAKAKKPQEAGYLAVTFKFEDIPIQAEETQERQPKLIEVEEAKLEPKSTTRSASARELLGRQLFGGGLASGFGQFQTMFSKRVEEVKVIKERPMPVSRKLDLAFVYKVPRSKLNINPSDDSTKDYFVGEGQVKGLNETDEKTIQLLDHFRISRP